jgi:hypothetical protein
MGENRHYLTIGLLAQCETNIGLGPRVGVLFQAGATNWAGGQFAHGIEEMAYAHAPPRGIAGVGAMLEMRKSFPEMSKSGRNRDERRIHLARVASDWGKDSVTRIL